MLFRKLMRDLWQNKTQFFSIFLMSLLGMWIFVGLESESAGGIRAAEQYYEEYNLPDLWVQGTNFSKDELKSIQELQGVEAAERRFMMNGNATLPDDPYLHIAFLSDGEISKMRLIEGEPFEAGVDGIYIEEVFAKHWHIDIGDTFSFKINNQRVEGIIKGYIEHPEFVYYLSDTDMMYPNYTKYGFIFMSDVMYPNQENVIYNQVIITLEDGVDAKAMKKTIEDLLDRDDVVLLDRGQIASYSTFHDEMNQHQAMGIMFSAVFVLISLLGIVTTMARVTANQRIQIGTMKALGFSKRTITVHYISYGFVISLVGSVLGAYLGYNTIAPYILALFEGAYVLPGLSAVFTMKSVYAVILSVAVSTAVSFIACRKELMDPPAVTLKPPAPKKVKQSFLEKSRLWLSFSFSTQWNYRDLKRNKMRSLMGVIGVAGCTMLMLCGFGCYDAINDMVDKMYGEILTGSYKIMLSDEATYSMAEDYANRYHGQMIQEGSVEFVSSINKKNGNITIVDTGNYLHFQDEQLKNTTLTKKGIAMTGKMAKSLGLKQGDFFKWRLVGDDKWQVSRIAQITRDPSVQGISMTREIFESFEYSFLPTAVWTNMTVPSTLIDEEDVTSVLNVREMKEAFSESLEIMNSMVIIMVSGAVILGFVVLYNLGVLSFVEKTREIATLKVLGFKSGKIRGILQKQNIWLTIAGILVGMPIGYLLLYGICSTMSEDMDVVPVIYLMSYLVSVGGTFLVSVTVNFVLSGKIKTINMVDALKGVE